MDVWDAGKFDDGDSAQPLRKFKEIAGDEPIAYDQLYLNSINLDGSIKYRVVNQGYVDWKKWKRFNNGRGRE